MFALAALLLLTIVVQDTQAGGVAYVSDDTASFNWTDISGTGTNLNLDDDGFTNVSLPFTFTYFGSGYSSVVVSSNGHLDFTSNAFCNENWNWANGNLGHPIPHGDGSCDSDGWGANPLIAPFFDDLDPGDCGAVYQQTLGTMPNRQFVVQYDDVCHWPDQASQTFNGATFQVVLCEATDNIVFQYLDTDLGAAVWDQGASATVGLSQNGTSGLQYSYNGSPAITDGLAVVFFPVGGSAANCATGGPAPTPTPTPEPNLHPWDVDEDGIVTVLDIGLVVLHFGEESPPPYPPWDVDKDGLVSVLDIGLVVLHFGEEF